jgi:predicted small lipoprotein YifL
MHTKYIRCHIPNKVAAIITVLVLALQGCGHKGPLTLPVPKDHAVQDKATSVQQPDIPPSQQIPSTK